MRGFFSHLTGTPHLLPLQAPMSPSNHGDSHPPTPRMDPIPVCCLKPSKVSAANRSESPLLLVSTAFHGLSALAHLASTFPSPPILNFCHPELVIPRTHHALSCLCSFTDGLFPLSEILYPCALLQSPRTTVHSNAQTHITYHLLCEACDISETDFPLCSHRTLYIHLLLHLA